MSLVHIHTIRVIGQTIRPKSLIFGSKVGHRDGLLLLQGQGQRSKFRSLPSRIVEMFHVPTKCFHFLYTTNVRMCILIHFDLIFI